MSARRRAPVQAPSQLLQWLEQRAGFELSAAIASSPLLRCIGRGDRHPVLVLPGFIADDTSTVPLRWAIRSCGYWAHGWRLGRNMGPTEEVLDGIRQRLDVLYERHEQKVSLIGWSLGGIYARELARQQPARVRGVITLGSPFRMVEGDRSAASAYSDQLRHTYASDQGYIDLPEPDKPPLPVPSTSIYTRSDGVVRWHTCLDEVTPTHENVEVYGSHIGLGFNQSVLYVIADRLALAEDDWKPFGPPLTMRWMYPPAASWEESSRAA